MNVSEGEMLALKNYDRKHALWCQCELSAGVQPKGLHEIGNAPGYVIC